MSKKARLVFSTDLNGTLTPDNTFAKLVEPDGLADEMKALMEAYTTGQCSFARVMPQMEKLARGVTKKRVEDYAAAMPLFPGAARTLETLLDSPVVKVRATLSTTAFAGLACLLNEIRFCNRLLVAASPVLLELLDLRHKRRLVRTVVAEADKAIVLEHLAAIHRPHEGLIFHVGDTLGDLPGLLQAAKLNGTGIAFCPNSELLAALALEAPKDLSERVEIVSPGPNGQPDYRQVLEIVRKKVFAVCGLAL
jgi:phosphoserine phosphatase